MIVHLIKEQTKEMVRAKCGAVGHPVAVTNGTFTGFDSRVTCVHCKPTLRELRKKRRVIIRRKETP